MPQPCTDCVETNSENPLPREGKSPRCPQHKELRRQWGEKQRQRRISQRFYERRAASAALSGYPAPAIPRQVEQTYKPERIPGAEKLGLTLDRQQTLQLKSIIRMLEHLNIEASQAVRERNQEEISKHMDEFLEQTAALHMLLRKPLRDFPETTQLGRTQELRINS